MYVYTPISYPIGGATSYTPYYVKFDENLKPQNTTNWEFGADLNSSATVCASSIPPAIRT
jgi:hypothetical protein